jgi:glycosyltransferase involved in cell wall biosynthesis
VPRVSVIIPVRDHPTFLAASVASVFAQPYRDLEVIVVDDGSREDLAPALAPFGARLRFERQPASGVAVARNRGVALACGEILAFHDADDLMEAERIRAPLARLDADPTLALVFGNGLRIDGAGTVLGPVIPPRQARRLARRGLGAHELLRRSLVYLQASVMPRSVFDAVGGFPLLTAGSDWAFTLRVALAHPVAFIDAPLFRYRQHQGSLTAARLLSARAAVQVLRDLPAREPAALARVGRRRLARALARRLARLAARELEVGNAAAADAYLAEAASLAPAAVKYRLRLLRLRLGARA